MWPFLGEPGGGGGEEELLIIFLSSFLLGSTTLRIDYFDSLLFNYS